MNYNKSTKILVTGGAGFVGSHLCERLIQDGYETVCLDNLSYSSLDNISNLVGHDGFEFIEGDIRDESLVSSIAPDFDVIYNLAAQGHVDRSIVEPRVTIDVNVQGLVNMLEAVRNTKECRIIHASTSEVYGAAQYVPMDELHPLDAPHVYGASKIAADRICAAYSRSYSMNVSIVRCFNIYGPKQRQESYGAVIPIFVSNAINGKSLPVFGDGSQTRDYLYIEDAIDAYMDVMNFDSNVLSPINFGTGREIAVKDLAKLIIELCDKTGSVVTESQEIRIGEVERLVADPSFAKRILGWKAKYTLEQGLLEYIRWYKTQ